MHSRKLAQAIRSRQIFVKYSKALSSALVLNAHGEEDDPKRNQQQRHHRIGGGTPAASSSMLWHHKRAAADAPCDRLPRRLRDPHLRRP